MLVFVGYSQKITVVNGVSKLPVSDCHVYDSYSQEVVMTDKSGEVDLSNFNKYENLVFIHMGYNSLSVKKENLLHRDTLNLIPAIENLDEVVLSVNKEKESKMDLPIQIEVVKQQEIKKLSIQNSADLLQTFPGVRVQRSQFGGGSPVIRGLEANRVLLVVDGVRMNNAIYRSGHLQNSITVSPEILERMEVVYGPSSVLYGSDALGGTIHYYTKSVVFTDSLQLNSSLGTTFSSVNNGVIGQVSGSISTKKFSSLTSVSYAAFDDLVMGENRKHGYDDWGKVFEYSDNTDDYYNPNPVLNPNPNEQKNTGYNQLDVLQKFLFKTGKTSTLGLNVQYSTTTDIPRFDKLTEYSNGALKFAEWYYGPQKRLLVSPQYRFSKPKKFWDAGVLIFGYQNIEESRINRKFSSLIRNNREEKVDVYSLNGDFSLLLKSKSQARINYGFELAYNDVQSKAIGKELDVNGNEIIGFVADYPIQTRYPDGGSSYAFGALYVAYKEQLNSKFNFNTGLRYTGTLLKAKWVDRTFIQLPEQNIELKNSALTATMGSVYNVNNNTRLRINLSSGFRSPNIDDVGKVREKNGMVTVPNVYLEPEYLYSGEIGLENNLFDNKLNLFLRGYYTLLHNYITRAKYTLNGNDQILYDGVWMDTYANVNKGNAYVLGGVFEMKAQLMKQLYFSGNISYTQGRTYDTDEPMSSIPPVFGSAMLNYTFKKIDFGLQYRFNTRKRLEDYNTVEGIDNLEQSPFDPVTGTYLGTPQWHIFNFHSSYQLSRNIQLKFNIENITDLHYKEFASAISAPGRNFVFGLNIDF